MEKPKIIERGWPGHFICADRCLFRRNTLIDFGRKKIIVSTVGLMRNLGEKGFDTIGAFGRYYETMAFEAKNIGPYWDINVDKQISFDSEWAICAKSWEKIPHDSDNKANAMHEAVVVELSKGKNNGDGEKS